MIKKHLLFIFFTAGLLLRIGISFTNYSGDVSTYMTWGKIGAYFGLRGLYEMNFLNIPKYFFPNYPPLQLLIFSFLFYLKQYIYDFAWFINLHIPLFPSRVIFFLKDFDFYPYLLKTPAILSDLGIALITFLIIKKKVAAKKSSIPLIISLFVLFNPAYIYNSSYWGQTDSIPLFFLLASYYVLYYKKYSILSGLLFTLALLSKQTVFLFIPFYSFIFLHKFGVKKFLLSLVFSGLIFWSSFMPFFKSGDIFLYPFVTYLNKILLVSGLPYTSNHAFNLWFILTGSRRVLASSPFVFHMSYNFWAYLVTFLLIALILIRMVKNRLTWEGVVQAGFLIPLIAFVFLTKMHERHLILVLPFLLLSAYKNRLYLVSFVFISFFNLINMYHNWWAPPLPLLQKLFSSLLVIDAITLLLIIVSLIHLVKYIFEEKLIRQIN